MKINTGDSAMKNLLVLILLAILSSCSGGGGSGSTGGQVNKPGEVAPATPSGNPVVDACEERIKTTVIENGVERNATPGEIAVQGYEIAKKCNFTEKDLEEFLVKFGY